MTPQQRLVFMVASLDDKDAADRALASMRQLLQGLPNRQAARQALQEILKGLDSCTRHGARGRLQIAVDALNLFDRPSTATLVPMIVKQALVCLSAQCRHDPAVTTALSALISRLAACLAEPDEGDTAAPAAAQGQWLYQELLSPLIKSSYRDPEARRVAAGCCVLSSAIEALAPSAGVPHLAVALRAGLAAALEHMWAGSAARRVSAAYAPFRPWVAAVGGSRLGEEGARRLAAICCRGAADKEAWQVRRDALQTLAALLTAAQADVTEPRKRSPAPLSRDPSSNTDAMEGVPERATWARTPGACSGALEVLAAQRGRLLDALDSCKHDAIAAVRAAAAEARAAAVKLPLAVPHAADGNGDGSPGKRRGGQLRTAAPGALTPTNSGLGTPQKLARQPSPIKTPPGLGCSSPTGGSAGRSGFQRPRWPNGTPPDFGVQVFAPPSPPRRQQQQQQEQQQQSEGQGAEHLPVTDAAAQTFDAWGPYSPAAGTGAGSAGAGSPGSHAAGSPFGHCYGSPQRMEVGHVFSGRVELSVGLPGGAATGPGGGAQQGPGWPNANGGTSPRMQPPTGAPQQQQWQPQQPQQQQTALPQALAALRHANSRVDGLLAELSLAHNSSGGGSSGLQGAGAASGDLHAYGGDIGHTASGGVESAASVEAAVLADIRRTLPELDSLVGALRASSSPTGTRGRGSPMGTRSRHGSPGATRDHSPIRSPRGWDGAQQAPAAAAILQQQQQQQQQQAAEWGHQQLQAQGPQQRSPRPPPPLTHLETESPLRSPGAVHLQQQQQQQQQQPVHEQGQYHGGSPPIPSPRHVTTQWHPSPPHPVAPAPDARSPPHAPASPLPHTAPPTAGNTAAAAVAAAADAAAAAAAGVSNTLQGAPSTQLGAESELLLALSWRLQRLARGFASSSRHSSSPGSSGTWPPPGAAAGDSSGGGSDGSLPRPLPRLDVLWEELESHKRGALASLSGSSGGDGSISFGSLSGTAAGPLGLSSSGGVGGSGGALRINTAGLPAAAIVMLKQHAEEEAEAVAVRGWWEQSAKRSSTGPGAMLQAGRPAAGDGGNGSPQRLRWAVPHAESAPPCVARWPSFGEPQI